MAKIKGGRIRADKGVPKGGLGKKHKNKKPRGATLTGSIASSIALKGNDFWRNRSRHGVEAIFTSPKLLLEAAQEYFDWCQNNPIYKAEWKGFKIVNVPMMRPVTLGAFALYCGVNDVYFSQFEHTKTYKGNEDFAKALGSIKQYIYEHKYNGGMVGLFNANLVLRDLGLVEKSEVKNDVPIHAPVFNVYNTAPPLASSEDGIDDKPKKEITMITILTVYLSGVAIALGMIISVVRDMPGHRWYSYVFGVLGFSLLSWVMVGWIYQSNRRSL